VNREDNERRIEHTKRLDVGSCMKGPYIQPVLVVLKTDLMVGNKA
jgi:hypothetical protein